MESLFLLEKNIQVYRGINQFSYYFILFAPKQYLPFIKIVFYLIKHFWRIEQKNREVRYRKSFCLDFLIFFLIGTLY